MPMSTNIHVPWGGRVTNLGLFKHQIIERYVHKHTKKAIYINIHVGSSKVGHRFGALHAMVPH